MTNRICSVDGCGRKNYARGWCSRHWYRWKQHGDPTGGRAEWGEAMAFLRSLPDTDDCVDWPFAMASHGYGEVRHEGAVRGAHVVALELHVGLRPDDAEVAMHSCDRGVCVNPRHLSWGTYRQNNLDAYARGRR